MIGVGLGCQIKYFLILELVDSVDYFFFFFGNQENCIKTRNLQGEEDSACLNTTQKCQILTEVLHPLGD